MFINYAIKKCFNPLNSKFLKTNKLIRLKGDLTHILLNYRIPYNLNFPNK